MNLDQIVTSLELSEKLKKLWVKQNSLFYWVMHGLNVKTGKKNWVLELIKHNLDTIPKYMASAYTASELAEMLPASLHGVEAEIIKFSHAGETPKYCARYLPLKIVPDCDENLANAMAKTIIYLIENKLMEVPK